MAAADAAALEEARRWFLKWIWNRERLGRISGQSGQGRTADVDCEAGGAEAGERRGGGEREIGLLLGLEEKGEGVEEFGDENGEEEEEEGESEDPTGRNGLGSKPITKRKRHFPHLTF